MFQLLAGGPLLYYCWPKMNKLMFSTDISVSSIQIMFALVQTVSHAVKTDMTKAFTFSCLLRFYVTKLIASHINGSIFGTHFDLAAADTSSLIDLLPSTLFLYMLNCSLYAEEC